MANEYTPVFDQEMARKMVVAANEGNELANTEFAQDIRTAPYGYLVNKYGQEVADNRRFYTQERAEVNRIENDERSVGSAVADTGLAVASGFVNTVGSVVGAGLAGIGAVDKYFDEENDAIANYAVDYTDTTRRATEWIKSFQSDELKARQGLTGVERQLDAEDNLAEFNRRTNNGEDATLVDDLQWIGRGTLNNAGRILSDPALATDVVAEGIGSLGPSAKLASVASNLVTRTATYNAAKIANAIAPTQGTKFLAMGAEGVNRAAIAATVGATEAAGVYSQTVNEVLGMTHGQLMETSEEYSKMVGQGVDPDDAKTTLAANAGIDAFKTSFPMAASLGIIAGRFEAMPMKSFRGEGFVGGLRQVGAQTLEEGGQGATGQLATNVAIRDTGVDPNRDPGEGVDEALATGMIAGTGMAGVMATPSVFRRPAPKTVSESPEQVQARVEAEKTADAYTRRQYNMADNVAQSRMAFLEGKTDPMTEAELNEYEFLLDNSDDPSQVAKAYGLLNEKDQRPAPAAPQRTQSPAGKAVSAIASAAATGLDTVQAVGSAAVNTRAGQAAISGTKAVASKAVDVATPAVQASTAAVTEFNARPNRKDQVRTLSTISEVASLSATDTTSNQGVQRIARTEASGPVPSTFSSTTTGNTTLARVGGIVSKLSEKGVRINKMSDSDVLYAASEMQNLRNEIPNLPTAMRAKVKDIIASEDFKNIQKRATRIDLMKTQDETKTVTDDMVTETKLVAAVNPANINPVVAGKILEQNDRTDVSPQDIQNLKTAKRIGEAITSRSEAYVEAQKKEVVELSVKPEYREGKKQTKPVDLVEAISRNIFLGSGDTRAPSVGQFASQIMQGAQNPDGTVEIDGIPTDVNAVTDHFTNFAQHMINKVDALNRSFQNRDANGNGTAEAFDNLGPNRKIRPGRTESGAIQGKAVTYQGASPGGIRFAGELYADAVAAVEVYNALAEAFPDRFPGGVLSVPDFAPNAPQTTLSDTSDPQTDVTEVETEAAPTAVEEEVSPRETSNEQDASVIGVELSASLQGESFAGVGSRKTPDNIMEMMTNIGKWLGEQGLVLNSGAAPGADSAFEAGTDQANGEKNIFIPWKTFQNRNLDVNIPAEAFEIAKQFHPAWGKLSQGAQKLMARNVQQVLGEDLNSPVKFVIGWTEGGKGQGGTGQAYRIAKAYGIPVFDLAVMSESELVQAIQEIGENQTPDIQEQDTEVTPPTLAEMMAAETRTKDDFSAMSYEELIDSANRWFVEEEDMGLEAMPEARQKVIKDITGPIIAYFNLPANLVTGITWLRTPDVGHMGQAMWGERLIAMRAGAVKTLLNGDNTSRDFYTAEHTVFHELMHIIDAYASNDVTRPASHSSNLFDTITGEEGAIFKEVMAAVETDPEMKTYFDYALSYNKIDTLDDLASEIFAEIGALYLEDTEKARQLFPEGVKYVESIIEQAGGTIVGEATDGSATQESSGEEAVLGQTTSVADKTFDNLNPKFNEAFLKRKGDFQYGNGDDILTMVSEQAGTENYVEFVRLYKQRVMDAANKRLATLKVNKSKKDELPIKDRIIAGDPEVGLYRRNKNTFAVDQTTGEYDPDLLSIAAVAVLDWLTGARSQNVKNLDEILEDMNLSYDMVNDEQINSIMNGVLPRDAAETLAKDIVRMWGLRINPGAPMVDARGVAEGMAKELLEAVLEVSDQEIAANRQPILGRKIVPYVDPENVEAQRQKALEEGQDPNTIKIKPVDQIVFDMSVMRDFQSAIGLSGQEAAKKMLAPELDTMPSIGAPARSIDDTQSRGDVKLSRREKKTLERMQNQGHELNVVMSDMVEVVGPEVLAKFLGNKDFSELDKNHPLRSSIAGKNLSIERDYQEAMMVVNGVKNAGFTINGVLPKVFYRVGISRVGRHQFKGINPQGNKILRALVTPTKALLNMDTKRHKDAFWLTVAQAADISGFNKVESQHHKFLLENIQEKFYAKYGEAVELIGEYLESGELDGAALVEAMGGTGEMQQLAAVFAVAQLEKALLDGTQGTFETTLSFELDGKTDGPGNMMANFGQGILTEQDFMNFKRVGFFLGTKSMTLNKFFGDGTERDLYEVTSLKGQMALHNAISNGSFTDKAKFHAIANLASAFGDLKIEKDQFVLTRNASKNPMTKTVYGSSERGIGVGLAQDMVLKMYQALIDNPDGIVDYPGGKEGFEADFSTAFGINFPKGRNWKKDYLGQDIMENFTKNVTQTLGKVLSDTAKEVIGDEITKVNDTLVLMTAFQTEFLTAKFRELLDAKVAERVADGSISTNKTTGAPDRSSLTQADYDAVVAQIRAYSPTYANGMQTLDIGSLGATNSGIKLSESMSNTFQAPSTMVSPELAGVKVIPYITQGRGDAMMMNWIYGGETAPENTLQVFDGIDMPIDKIFEYAQQINSAVLQNWEADVIGDIVNDVTGFLEKTANDGDLLLAAWTRAFENAQKKKTTATAKTPEELIGDVLEMQRRNQARKAVFKRIGVSVDHMGGSDTAFTQGPDGREYSLGEINDMIREELGERAPRNQNDQTVNPDGSIDGEFTEINLDAFQIESQSAPVETVARYDVAMVRANPNKVYVFGDNLIGRGKAGQAVIRDEPNAIGIPTKRLPSMNDNAFFGQNIQEEKAAVTAAINQIIKAKKEGKTVVMPADGVGTGLANLKGKAPEVYAHLQRELERAGLPFTPVETESRAPVEGEFSKLVITDAATVMDSLLRETRNKPVAAAVRILQKVNLQTRIIIGSPEEVSQWYSDNIGEMDGGLNQDRNRTEQRIIFERIASNIARFEQEDNAGQDAWLKKSNEAEVKEVETYILNSTADEIVTLVKQSGVKTSYINDIIYELFVSADQEFPFDSTVDFANRIKTDSRQGDLFEYKPQSKAANSVMKKGIYDPVNDVMLITDNNHETLVHELIHAATFKIIEAFHNGDQTHKDTIARLEVLNQEFLDMDFSNAPQSVQDSANSAKSQILSLQVQDTAFSKAAALNEMMAWTLSNEGLMKELGQKQTSLMARMTKTLKALMQRMLGGVKSDILSNIQFNTELLITPTQPLALPAPVADPLNQLTPGAQKMTNFWIDLAQQRLDEATKSPGRVSEKLTQISDYRKNAQSAIDTLTFGGFTLSAYQRETFKAIHMVLAMEMRLNPQSAAALNEMFKHVTDNLTPAMFGPTNQQDRYSAVMEIFGETKNDEGVSDAIAVLLALSQTSRGFRAAIDQLPVPQPLEGVSNDSVNDFLSSITGMLLNKAIGTIDLNGQSVSETLDNLAESILLEESEREFRILSGLMKSINKADEWGKGGFKKLAGFTEAVNDELRASNRSQLTKLTFGAVTAATAFLDQDRADIQAQALKRVTHIGTNLDFAVFAREFVAEVIGTDETNAKVTAMLDDVTYNASVVRQNYREDLPVMFQDEFQNHPDANQWKAAHKVLGKTDFAVVYDQDRPNTSFEYFKDENLIDDEILDLENVIRANFSTTIANVILEKAQQLADFNNGKGPGHQLWRNAFAINTLAGEFKGDMTASIDELITFYAMKGSDPQMRQEIARMYEADPVAMQNLAVYMKALNKEEDSKIVTEEALMNGYKGYIPDLGQPGTKMIIAKDEDKRDLEKKGYKRVADAPGDDGFSSVNRGYYVTSTKQTGNYSQGVMQIIQDTYRGVDATSGLSVNGMTSGVITGAAVVSVTNWLNSLTSGLTNKKEALLPVYTTDGVLHYERFINPDLLEKYTAPKSNLALMLGAWAGRQVEEKIAQKYNAALIDQLKATYDEREEGDDNLFINLPKMAKAQKEWDDATVAERRNMKKPDPVYVESWKVISPQTKRYIEEVFGKDTFMVRKDQMNIALGYRDPSVIDLWTGNTRVPDGMREGVQAITGLVMGDKAMRNLAFAEKGLQGLVSTAKDLIVVRSLVVPYMNTQANVVQLSTRGVPLKEQLKGYKNKLAEIEKFNLNVKEVMRLDTRIQLAGTDANKVRILQNQKQVILDENARMSVAPLIKAGAYKNISEGLSDMDVEITGGRLGDWVEKKIDSIPNAGVRTIAKYGILSKDTAIYKGANKAVQYGDFIAKAIYYDHLIQKGLSDADAMKLVNEEFVNFSVLPGRTRSYLEGIGATWFLAFKIRIMKIAMNQIRENPARSLILGATIADYGSPQADNLASVIVDERIGYALGWDMLFNSPGLNPWVNLTE